MPPSSCVLCGQRWTCNIREGNFNFTIDILTYRVLAEQFFCCIKELRVEGRGGLQEYLLQGKFDTSQYIGRRSQLNSLGGVDTTRHEPAIRIHPHELSPPGAFACGDPNYHTVLYTRHSTRWSTGWAPSHPFSALRPGSLLHPTRARLPVIPT